MCPWASHFTIQNLSFVIKGVVISRLEADWVVTIVPNGDRPHCAV